MKHVSQQMISVEVRRPYLRKHRRRLQKALSSPGLSADQRRVLERDLRNVGDPKVYDADDPPRSGALRGGDAGPVQLDLEGASHETLAAVPHTTLYLYALQQDLKVSPGNTKAQVVSTILAHVKGEQR